MAQAVEGGKEFECLWCRGSPQLPALPVLKDRYRSVCSVKHQAGGRWVCKEPLAAGNGLTQEIMTDNKRQQEAGVW